MAIHRIVINFICRVVQIWNATNVAARATSLVIVRTMSLMVDEVLTAVAGMYAVRVLALTCAVGCISDCGALQR
jgi:hypothetical protein